MKDLYFFARTYFRKLSFGGQLTLLSSFGQTFLIAVYVPEIIREFNISEGGFGALYAACTMIASVFMLSLGHTVDHKPAKWVTGLTVVILAFSCFLLGISTNILLLFMALIGLRLSGQGLLSHISMTVISKYFDKNRGKALSLSSLGYSIGEAIFPLVIAFLISFFSWRFAALISGGFLLLYLIKLKYTDLSGFDARQTQEHRPRMVALLRDYKSLVLDRRFGIMMPASFILSFSVTAIFFYQYIFVEQKGWSVQLYAGFFTAYAITRLVFSIFGGLWVDRFSAKVMFRYFLIPILLGLLPFSLMNSIFGALFFLILAGITVGISGTVQTALIAEIYGTAKMGTIRSMFTMFMVISTALGPLLVGFLIDLHMSFSTIMLLIFAAMLLVTINNQRIGKISAAD